MREAMEELFFFNPRQAHFQKGIRRAVERYGAPAIRERNGRLYIGLASDAGQCVFALDTAQQPERLAGVVLYARPRPEVLAITHLAVAPDYASGGKWGGEGLGLMLVEMVRQIGNRIQGIERIELPYGPGGGCRWIGL